MSKEAEPLVGGERDWQMKHDGWNEKKNAISNRKQWAAHFDRHVFSFSLRYLLFLINTTKYLLSDYSME